jgi:hypothetical protein
MVLCHCIKLALLGYFCPWRILTRNNMSILRKDFVLLGSLFASFAEKYSGFAVTEVIPTFLHSTRRKFIVFMTKLNKNQIGPPFDSPAATKLKTEIEN